MKIFVAGATGALGRQLVPKLAERGHEVTGMTRTESKRALLEELGATPVLADALDADAVGEAVAKAEPEVVVHQLTAIGKFEPRNVDGAFAETNRLRTEGTDILLAAAKAAGARRFVAQSNAMVPYERVGGPVKTEEDPLMDDPPASFARSLLAIKHVERAVTSADGIEGVVLRYGGFYGRRHLPRARRRPVRGRSQAPDAHRRRWRRHLVLHRDRGRGGRDGRRNRGRVARHLQRRR